MTWLLLGLTPAFLWAIINHIDKYLLSKISGSSSAKVLMVYSSAFSIVVIPIAFLMGHNDLFLDTRQVILQIIGGIVISASIYLGLLALSKEEASKVVPLFLITPIFGYLFSLFFLGELLSLIEIVGCVLILAGALILTLEFNEETKKTRIRHDVLLIMAGCTFLQASQETVFKYVTVNNSFTASIFWEHIGILLFGIIFVLFNKKIGIEFLNSVKNSGATLFSINFFSESLNVVGFIVRTYSLLLAPIAIIMSLNGFQPVFVFIIGIFLTKLFPHLGKEKLSTKHLAHKIVSIVIMLTGTILIASTI